MKDGHKDVRTPIRGWNKNTVSSIADIIKKSVKTTTRSRRDDDMFWLNRHMWMKIGVKKRCQSVQGSWIATEAKRVREVL
jgi:hypothetical protein